VASQLTDLSFGDWILFVFCWPEAASGIPGYGHQWLTEEYWAGPPAVTVNYLTRLFEHPAQVLSDFSDGEIAQGLWDILGDSEYATTLADLSVPLADRLRCLEAIAILFRDLFAVRCSPHLKHRSEAGNPLNGVCYMWWDLFWVTPVPEERTVMFETILRSLTQILHLPSMACQEAALHGFGHWLDIDENRIQAEIDRWLQHHPDLRPELRTYALSARCGYVL
jgi:hypothetical protein